MFNLIVLLTLTLLLGQTRFASRFLIPLLGAGQGQSEGDEIVDRSAADIFRLRGFMAEELTMTTSDGYILNIVHATNPLINKGTTSKLDKDPVIFLHGILTNARCFVVDSTGAFPQDFSTLKPETMSPEDLFKMLGKNPNARSMPFLLLTMGHDVFMVNRRGTRYSRGRSKSAGGSSTLGPEDKEVSPGNYDDTMYEEIDESSVNREPLEDSPSITETDPDESHTDENLRPSDDETNENGKDDIGPESNDLGSEIYDYYPEDCEYEDVWLCIGIGIDVDRREGLGGTLDHDSPGPGMSLEPNGWAARERVKKMPLKSRRYPLSTMVPPKIREKIRSSLNTGVYPRVSAFDLKKSNAREYAGWWWAMGFFPVNKAPGIHKTGPYNLNDRIPNIKKSKEPVESDMDKGDEFGQVKDEYDESLSRIKRSYGRSKKTSSWWHPFNGIKGFFDRKNFENFVKNIRDKITNFFPFLKNKDHSFPFADRIKRDANTGAEDGGFIRGVLHRIKRASIDLILEAELILKFPRIFNLFKNQHPIQDEINYWNYSIDTEVAIDFPEIVDFVLNVTIRKKVHLVGHSLGAGIPLLALSRTPELGNKFSKMLLWAPAINLGATPKNEMSFFRKVSLQFKTILEQYIGPVPFTELEDGFLRTVSRFCSFKPSFIPDNSCERVVSFSFGQGARQQKLNRGILSMSIDKTSSYQLAQLIQFMSQPDGSHYYTYPIPEDNMRAYNQTTAPKYDMGTINFTGISIFYGNKDDWVQTRDVEFTISQLKVPTIKTKLLGDQYDPHLQWNHNAFLSHKEVVKYLTLPGLQALYAENNNEMGG